MSKRLFQVLDEMNVNDDKNKTATCGCCFDVVGANKVKQGGHVTMGVPVEAVLKIFLGEYQPMLVLLDKKEYERLRAQPADSAEASVKARGEIITQLNNRLTNAETIKARYEKALNAILNTNHDNHEKVILKVKTLATEALTPKQTTDDTVNG